MPAIEETRTIDFTKLSSGWLFDEALRADDPVASCVIYASAMRQNEMTLVRLMSIAFLSGIGS